MPGGTDLYLGLIHDDDADGNAARLATARIYAPVAGVAAECGLGRSEPDRLIAMLEAHRRTVASGGA